MTGESTESESRERSWGFPAFAKGFPRHPRLDALVAAFERGDYATVRREAPALASDEKEDDAVRRAARVLRERIEPDPASRTLFWITAAILIVLSGWWVTHSGPEGNGHRPAVAPGR